MSYDDLLETDAGFEPEPLSGDEPEKPGQISGPDPRLELSVKVLRQLHQSLEHVIALLEGADAAGGAKHLAQLVMTKAELARATDGYSGLRTVEGVFDGLSMVGGDGSRYPVPPNYASKSRLVEGDMLKLTIRPDGTFVFKQIGPVERRRIVGNVAHDPSTDEHVVVCDEGTFKVLHASVTFFQAGPGDEAVVLLPKSGNCVWAALENVVKK